MQLKCSLHYVGGVEIERDQTTVTYRRQLGFINIVMTRNLAQPASRTAERRYLLEEKLGSAEVVVAMRNG